MSISGWVIAASLIATAGWVAADETVYDLSIRVEDVAADAAEVYLADGVDGTVSGEIFASVANPSGWVSVAVPAGFYDVAVTQGAATYVIDDIDCTDGDCFDSVLAVEAIVDFGALSPSSVEVFVTDQLTGTTGGLVVSSHNLTGVHSLIVLSGIYDIRITNRESSILFDVVPCLLLTCDVVLTPTPVISLDEALTQVGDVLQILDAPSFGGVWVSTDQQTLFLSMTGDLEAGAELLRIAGLDVSSTHVEIVTATYSHRELEAVFDSLMSDGVTLRGEHGVWMVALDEEMNWLELSTEHTDTAALETYLATLYDPGMIVVRGGVPEAIFSEVGQDVGHIVAPESENTREDPGEEGTSTEETAEAATETVAASAPVSSATLAKSEPTGESADRRMRAMLAGIGIVVAALILLTWALARRRRQPR